MGGVVVHLGFGGMSGFFIFGGTSAGAPQWAGVVADINQALGRPMGFINDRLYKLGQTGLRELEEHERGEWGERGERGDRAGLFHDITVGDNGFCGFTTPSGAFACVPGFSATPGWDLATGWGSPHEGLIAALIADGDDDDDNDDGYDDGGNQDDGHQYGEAEDDDGGPDF
jgi:subtilase family serine protease